MNISEVLINWFNVYKRDLPWRFSDNPYHIWISEILLQQTRVQQAIRYYYSFLEIFPTIDELACSQEDTILKVWQGLGYYSRARNMHKTAKIIVANYHSKFPGDYEMLLKLPGIGNYTAGAIASIAFNIPVPAIDGNIMRVISRIYGVFHPLRTRQATAEIENIVVEILDKKQPGIFNQALMELGAMICVPKKPLCKQCPVIEYCFAAKHEIIDQLPNIIKNKKPASRYFNYFFIYNDAGIWLRKRNQNDIWRGLYEPFLVETRTLIPMSKFLNLLSDKISGSFIYHPETYIRRKHQLTHQTIHAQFIKVKLSEKVEISGMQYFNCNELKKLPLSRLIDWYYKKYFTV